MEGQYFRQTPYTVQTYSHAGPKTYPESFGGKHDSDRSLSYDNGYGGEPQGSPCMAEHLNRLAKRDHDSIVTQGSTVHSQPETPTSSTSGYSEYFPENVDDEPIVPSSKRRRRGPPQTPIKTPKTRRESTGTPSKLGKKRANLVKELGEGNVANDVKPRGVVQIVNEALYWWNGDGNIWLPAAYHNDLREVFIAIDSANSPYQKAPAHGEHYLDVTSNCNFQNQHLWQLDNSSQFRQILDIDGNRVFELDEEPEHHKVNFDPGFMYHRGLIILDMERNPVKDWRQLPLCLSSKLEGSRVEAFKRVFPWIQTSDLRARMPSEIYAGGKTKMLYGLSTIRHRALRFRKDNRLIPWDARKGTAELKAKWAAENHQINEVWLTSETDNMTAVSSPKIRALQAVNGDRRFTNLPRVHTDSSFNTRGRNIPAIGIDRVINNGVLSNTISTKIDESLATGKTRDDEKNLLTPPSLRERDDTYDIRCEAPETMVEKMQIQGALKYTCWDFERLHGHQPSKTWPEESYMRQYFTIADEHIELWKGDNPPELFHVETWAGSLQQQPPLSSYTPAGYDLDSLLQMFAPERVGDGIVGGKQQPEASNSSPTQELTVQKAEPVVQPQAVENEGGNVETVPESYDGDFDFGEYGDWINGTYLDDLHDTNTGI